MWITLLISCPNSFYKCFILHRSINHEPKGCKWHMLLIGMGLRYSLSFPLSQTTSNIHRWGTYIYCTTKKYPENFWLRKQHWPCHLFKHTQSFVIWEPQITTAAQGSYKYTCILGRATLFCWLHGLSRGTARSQSYSLAICLRGKQQPHRADRED